MPHTDHEFLKVRARVGGELVAGVPQVVKMDALQADSGQRGKPDAAAEVQGGPKAPLAPPTRPGSRLASDAGRLARKAKAGAAETRGSRPGRGGFDTGTPRGGSIRLMRSTWEGRPIADTRAAAASTSTLPL